MIQVEVMSRIEAKVYLFGKIPLSAAHQTEIDEEYPGKIYVKWAKLVQAIAGTHIFDQWVRNELQPYAFEEEVLKIIGDDAIEGEKDGERVIFSKEEINKQRLQSKGLFGASVRFRYK